MRRRPSEFVELTAARGALAIDRRVRASLTATLLALTIVGTLVAPRMVTAQAVRPVRTPPAPAAFVLAHLDQLEAGQSLAEWRRMQPAGRVEPLLTDFDESYGSWCARVVDQARLDGAVLKRAAYFYPPSPTPALQLPTTASSALRNQCRLGLLETSIEFHDPRRADDLGTQVRWALDDILKTRVTDTQVVWGGSANWHSSGWWTRGRASVLTAVAPSDYTDRREPLEVLVLASGPARAPGFGSLPPSTLFAVHDMEQRRERLRARMREAFDVAGIGGTADAEMRTLASRAAQAGSRESAESQRATSAVAVLERWLAAADPLPVPRRAAALLAADLVLASTPGPWQLEEGAEARRRLGRYGATFQWDQLGSVFHYPHDWLKVAATLAPESRAADLAFMTLLEMGFETSAGCGDQDGEGFRAVIREGRAFLAAHPDAAVRADVELFVGQAYADIVALAHGVPEEYANPERYRNEEASARQRAIDHLRAGLRGPVTAADRPHAWETAWRLLAGLAPLSTTYFCIYD